MFKFHPPNLHLLFDKRNDCPKNNPCFKHQILANLKVNSYLIPLNFEDNAGAILISFD